MKKINISRDVQSRRNISHGQPAPPKTVENPVIESLKEEDAKSEEIQGTPPDAAPGETEKPKKRERKTKADV